MPRKTTFGLPGNRVAALGFNEAAARCRGKPPAGRGPQPGPPRFNEAAARCRGKLTSNCSSVGGDRRFNEAAARCRGKRRISGGADSALTLLQ